jgi:hypothetical protein
VSAVGVAAGGAGAGKKATAGKKEPGECRLFQESGECKFGDECRYKHGDGDGDQRDFSAPRQPAARRGESAPWRATWPS